jgi:hypothetical protein
MAGHVVPSSVENGQIIVAAAVPAYDVRIYSLDVE